MTIAQPKSMTENVYQRIKADILSCRHAPGSRLRINILTDELGSSLGAVREALSRLAAEGFVISEAQKGYQVSPVSPKDLEDLTRTRVTIESMCLESAMERGGVEWETEIVGCYHRLSRIPETVGDEPRLSDDWAIAHARFHHALVSACDSEWLLRIRAMLFDQSDRYRRMSAADIHANRDLKGEHHALMESTLARDVPRVKILIKEHFVTTATLVARLADLGELSVA